MGATPNTTRSSAAEAAKLLEGFLRHLTTLFTAAILILLAVVQRFNQPSPWLWLVVVAFVFFILGLAVALLGLVITLSISLGGMNPLWRRKELAALREGDGRDEGTRLEAAIDHCTLATLLAYFCFILGLGAVALFAVLNLQLA